MYTGIEAGTAIPSIAALGGWGLSFFGMNRYLQGHKAGHGTRPDNGFYMLLSIFVSLAVGIGAAASASLLMAQPSAASGVQVTGRTVVTAIAVVVLWGISFLGISRRMLSRHHEDRERDNGFIILLSAAASLAVAVAAAAVASSLQSLQSAQMPSALAGVTAVDLGLALVVLAVLVGPFAVRKIEHNLEAFLFVMGILSVTIAGAWEMNLIFEAVKEPVVKGIVPAVLVAGLAAGNFINPPYAFPIENNLAFTDFVRLHQKAAEFLERNYPEVVVATSWPAHAEFSRPDLGYVRRKLRVRRLPDLRRATVEAVDWGGTDILVLYTSTWEPRWDLLRFGRELRQSAYGYEPDITPAEVRAKLPLELAARWERRGQWVEIYRGPGVR